MKYDVFIRTKTRDARKYDWVNRPDYLSSNVHETCKSLISLCSEEAFGDLSWDDWESNFFYLRRAGFCMLARVAKTDYTDSNGERIITFEGVCVKKENEKHLFYHIPSLINEMFPPAKCFRTTLENQGSVPNVFEIKPLLNPFDGFNVPGEVNSALSSNAAYRNLLKFTAFTEKPAGFIFGKNATDFSEFVDKEGLRIKHVFDFVNPESPNVNENAFTDSYTPVSYSYKPPEPTGKDKVSINIMIQQNDNDTYKYRWEIKPWENSGMKDSKRIRYVTKFFEIKDSVELARLELQKENIRRFLFENGWTKQQVGLRFEKDLFKRED